MKRLMIKNSIGWSKLSVFVSGMIIGAIVALSSPGLSAGEDVEQRSTTSILYALAALAVDSEINASRIVALVTRVEHLEETQEQMSGEKN